MWLLRSRVELARRGAWSVVTHGPPHGPGAGMATQITPQAIKLENLSVSSSARATRSLDAIEIAVTLSSNQKSLTEADAPCVCTHGPHIKE